MYLLIRMCSACVLICAGVFTSHYVSINSLNCWQSAGGICKFTSHYVSINSPSPLAPNISGVYNLHPTMYLLILVLVCLRPCWSLFTSHYVSINSWLSMLSDTSRLAYLHPTMYLLIPAILQPEVSSGSSFTSHYVSINSEKETLLTFAQQAFTSHYVSINSRNY